MKRVLRNWGGAFSLQLRSPGPGLVSRHKQEFIQRKNLAATDSEYRRESAIIHADLTGFSLTMQFIGDLLLLVFSHHPHGFAVQSQVLEVLPCPSL